MTNLDSILKSRDITLPAKVHPVKAMVFPVVMYGWEKAMATHPNTLACKFHGQRSLVGCGPWSREESDMTERLHFHSHAWEKEMANHSSVLTWRVPGKGEPGGLLSMGSHRVGHD